MNVYLGGIVLRYLKTAIFLSTFLPIFTNLAFPIDPTYYDMSIQSIAVAGDDIPIIVIPRTSGGAPIPGYTGTVDFFTNTGNGVAATNPTLVTFDGGDPQSSWNGTIQLKTAGDSVALYCMDANGASGTAYVNINAGAADKLLIILPGQTYTPGVNHGIAPVGQMPAITQGVYYGITVLVTDQNSNYVDTFSDTVTALENGVYFYPRMPSTAQFMPLGIAYYTMEAQTGSVSGDVITIELISEAGLHYDNVKVVSHSASSGVSIISVPTEVYAGEPFYVSVSIKSSDQGGILTNNNDRYTFEKYDAITNKKLPDDTQRDDLGDFDAISGVYGPHEYHFNKAATIYLKARQDTQASIPISGFPSAAITILPNIPAGMSIKPTPSEVESNHQSLISATILDQYGNKTPSSRYHFHVTFHNTSPHGTLSVTSTATDSTGVATSIYTAGAINEAVVIDVAVIDNASSNVYAYQSVTVHVSAAPVKPGAIVNYPNPFDPGRNETTSISYYLEESSNIELRIFDPFGRVVVAKSFSKDSTDPISFSATTKGAAAWIWDGKNGEGRTVANGIYLVKVKAQSSGQTQEFKRRVGVIK